MLCNFAHGDISLTTSNLPMFDFLQDILFISDVFDTIVQTRR